MVINDGERNIASFLFIFLPITAILLTFKNLQKFARHIFL